MILSEMVRQVNSLIDDVATLTDIVSWLNNAKDDMATVVEAKFPDLVATNSNDTFVFDSKYHEIPIIYAVARFKQKDDTYQEANVLMQQYEAKKRTFQAFYVVPPQYKDDPFSQQFTATTGQTVFGAITKPTYIPDIGNLTVYYNNVRQERQMYVVNNDKTFTWLGDDLAAGALLTATWEENAELVQPPYSWMGSW